MPKKIILLKLTGEIFLSPDRTLTRDLINSIAMQIHNLASTHFFGIVIGGGNFFRGSKQGKTLGITPSVAHQIGMLATMMNGLMIKDIFEQHAIPCTLFCAVPAPEIGTPISQQAISSAQAREHCMVFTGGTGNPFFTTDTTAVLRGLQIGASAVWKGTSVDGIYTDDPKSNPQAKLIPIISYNDVFNKQLGIMDTTSIALAKDHNLKIRVFNIFKPDAIIHAAQNETFGSTIS